MHFPRTATWLAGPLVHQFVGRALALVSVLHLAMGVALLASAGLPSAMARTSVGLLAAVALAAVGDLLARQGRQWFWYGTGMLGGGYAMALFFANATFYVGGLSAMDTPYAAWLLQLSTVLLATVHISRNRILRWVAPPVTMATSLWVLVRALGSGDVVSVGPLTAHVSAVSSILALAWWLGLSILYKRLEKRDAMVSGAVVEEVLSLMYKICHESCFVAAGVMAVIVPHYCTTPEYAPLWWALEMPLLLVICWRSNSFLKHSLLMGIWGLSAVLLLINNQLELSALVRMAVPVSGMVMALTYRYMDRLVASTWPHWQKVVGYSVYLYTSTCVALLVPALQLGVWEAMPYWLLQSMILCSLALRLEDRVLQLFGYIIGSVSLVLFAAHWQHWNGWLVIAVTLYCYLSSIRYGWVYGRKGWPKSDYCPLPGKTTLTEGQAYYMERVTAVTGFVTAIAGAYLLLANPYNTICWGAFALVILLFGFIVDKVGHRFSGLLALGLASVKLTIFDLSGASGATQTMIGFVSIGGCCILAGAMYQFESYRRARRKKNENPGEDNASGKDNDQSPPRDGDDTTDGGSGGSGAA